MALPWWRALIAVPLLIVSLGIFAVQLYRIYRMIRIGGGPVPLQPLGARLREVLVQVLGHRKVLRQVLAGVLHLLIFWGFLVLFTTIVQAVGEAFVPGWTLPVIGASPVLAALQDVFIVLVLVGIAMAVWWRKVLRPKRLAGQDQRSAYLILIFISGIMVTLLLSRAGQIALEHPPWAGGAPLSSLVGRWLSAAPPIVTRGVFEAAWWGHLLIILLFLSLIPQGKHLHLITLVPNVFLQKRRHRGALVAIEIEQADHLGASRVEHFTWKDHLDAFACMECGRCVEVCPANSTGKELDPRRLHTDLRRQLARESQPAGAANVPKLVGEVFSEEFLWQCLTCGACVEECPAANDHIDKIVEMRRHLTMEEARVPGTMGEALRSLEARGHPFRGAGFSRTAWTSGATVRVLDGGTSPDWLLWTGCASALNERNHAPLRALARLLGGAGIDVAILGDAETCTGDPARRIGNEYLFQTLAQQNIETLNRFGIGKIVTPCPHCYNTIKNEYPQFGGRYEVWHHTQLLARLVEEGRIAPKTAMTEVLTFHDPCYLGRHNGEYEAPRRLLASIPGARAVEMAQCRERGFCCGAGGGLYWVEDRVGQRVSHVRTHHAVATGAQVVATACPFCLLMLEDGATATSSSIRPMDVAEIVDRSTNA